MAVTRDQVIWAYRTLLRRDPENETVIADQIASHQDRIDLILFIAGSAEFVSQYQHGDG